jgi:hypothetical protein
MVDVETGTKLGEEWRR